MTSAMDKIRQGSSLLSNYAEAVESFAASVETLRGAIDQLGSDPLGVLSILDGPLPEPDNRPLKQKKRIEAVPKGEGEPPEFQKGADEKAIDKQSEGSFVESPRDVAVGKANKTKPRGELTPKIHAAQQWLYRKLIDGPSSRNDLVVLAERAGLSFYVINEARRHSPDIIQKTVGLRGPSWWFIAGDEKKLPSGKKKAKAPVLIDPKDQGVLEQISYRGTHMAALIGRTGLKPTELRESLSRLQGKGMVSIDKASGMWKPVAA